MTINELKKYEGNRILFNFRGKDRPFILQAVQDTEPDINNLIGDSYLGSKVGDFRIDYDYPGNREWAGFWTDKIDRVVSIIDIDGEPIY